MYQLVSQLLNPFLLLMILIGVLVASLWWKRGTARKRVWLLTIGFALLWFACTPLAAHLSLSTLERSYPTLEKRPADVEAIVVLGGAVRPPKANRNWTELEHDTLRRCVEAARLYRQGDPVTVVVSGGKVDPTQPGATLAESMAEFLEAAGVESVTREETSRSTYENAVHCAAILRDLGADRCLLVTDTTHLKRATACFQAEGIQCVPAGVYCRSEALSWEISTFLPSPAAAESQQVVLHEWVGLLWYRLDGRI